MKQKHPVDCILRGFPDRDFIIWLFDQHFSGSYHCSLENTMIPSQWSHLALLEIVRIIFLAGFNPDLETVGSAVSARRQPGTGTKHETWIIGLCCLYCLDVYFPLRFHKIRMRVSSWYHLSEKCRFSTGQKGTDLKIASCLKNSSPDSRQSDEIYRFSRIYIVIVSLSSLRKLG